MAHIFARPKKTVARRKISNSSPGTKPAPTSSEQETSETNTATYKTGAYEVLLKGKNSFLDEYHLGISDESKILCRSLLDAEQSVPEHSPFSDEFFKETCKNIHGRNEAMISRDITPLICPSAQLLRIYGAKHLEVLMESVNEAWDSAIPLLTPRPKPDFSVGFDRLAFSDTQFEKLESLTGQFGLSCSSLYKGTYQTFFPFLTCEAKSGGVGLDVADRQNGHSMTLAVRGVLELFRLLKREKELHRETIAFSISHDYSSVRLYAHYAAIGTYKTTYHRHKLDSFDIAIRDGRDKWIAYKFTKNIYDTWMPMHLRRICSAIDQLPVVNFDMSERSEPRSSNGSELQQISRQFEAQAQFWQAQFEAADPAQAQLLQEANAESSSPEGRVSADGYQDTTAQTSMTREVGPAFKRPKNQYSATQS